MQGEYFILRTKEHRYFAAQALGSVEPSPDKPYYVKIAPYDETRRDAQNRLSHMWYSEISKQGGEYTAEDIKCIAKLRWGVPILVAEDEQFAAFWQKVKTTCPTYEERMEAMRYIPVTSIMTVKQMSQYLTDMQRVSSQKYQLTDPSLLGLDELRYGKTA